MSLHNYQKPEKINHTQLFINGIFTDSVQKGEIEIINPCNESVICKISEATQKDIELAVQNAQLAKDRCKLLNLIADDIEKNLKEYIEIESLNTGRPLQQSELEIQQIIEIFRFYAGTAEKMSGKTFQQNNQMQYTRIEPIGVVGIISSWSSQFLNSAKIIAPSLATGNTIVHKPSEITPLSLLRFCQTLQNIQLPSGVYNLLPGYGPTAGKELSNNNLVKLLCYSGSKDTGKIVLQNRLNGLQRSRHIMNSKCPIIIGPDVDVVGCANLAWATAMYNMGQNSVAGSKLLVHEQIYDKLIANLKTIAKSNNTVIGDPFEGANHGPQINKFQLEKCLSFIDNMCKNHEASIFYGGKQQGDKGFYIQPTVLINSPDNNSEDVLGPILQILKPWRTLDEVIQRVNNNNGMGAIVMVKDQGVCQKLVQNLQVGNIFINCWMNPQIYMPFNPQKESGYDVQGGEDIIYQYTTQKAVYHQLDAPNIQ